MSNNLLRPGLERHAPPRKHLHLCTCTLRFTPTGHPPGHSGTREQRKFRLRGLFLLGLPPAGRGTTAEEEPPKMEVMAVSGFSVLMRGFGTLGISAEGTRSVSRAQFHVHPSQKNKHQPPPN